MVKEELKGCLLDCLHQCSSEAWVLQIIMRRSETLHRYPPLTRLNGADLGGELIGAKALSL